MIVCRVIVDSSQLLVIVSWFNSIQRISIRTKFDDISLFIVGFLGPLERLVHLLVREIWSVQSALNIIALVHLSLHLIVTRLRKVRNILVRGLNAIAAYMPQIAHAISLVIEDFFVQIVVW